MAGGASKTLSDVIRRALDYFAADLHVGIPARVERFDAATGLADVKPLVRDPDPESGEARSVPVIVNVPVQFPGAGGFRVTFPVAAGDPCFLIFSDRSLDLWLSRGGEVDPLDPRRHALSDAVALLGVRPAATPWANVATDALTIGHDGAGPRVEFKSGEMVLDGGTHAVARVTDPVTVAAAWATWFGAVGTATGAGAPPAGAIGAVGGGAARVKA